MLAACGGDAQPGGGWAGTVDPLANGAVLVSNPDQGIWRDGEGWQLVEELRIGSAEAEGPELFGRVHDLARDELGRIYVADGQANEIRVFGPGGEFIRTLGREGAGPGEFAFIGGLDWGPEGNLWVMDFRNARLSVYDTTGAFLTTRQRPPGFMYMPWPGRLDGEGGLYDIALIDGGANGRGQFAIVRYDERLEALDTFRIPAFEGEQYLLTDAAGRSRMSTPVPFAARQFWHLGADGLVRIGTSDIYRIVTENFAGDTLQIVERDFKPVAVSAAERAAATDELEPFISEGGNPDLKRIPGTKPAFGSLFTDPGGHLWVTALVPEGEADAWDIFRPDGRYLGQVEKPAGIAPFEIPLVDGDRLYAVVRDELEVPYVVRYRITGRDIRDL